MYPPSFSPALNLFYNFWKFVVFNNIELFLKLARIFEKVNWHIELTSADFF